MVAGGLSVMSKTTLLMPLTSFVIRLEILFRTLWGIFEYVAVIKSPVFTALRARV